MTFELLKLEDTMVGLTAGKVSKMKFIETLFIALLELFHFLLEKPLEAKTFSNQDIKT